MKKLELLFVVLLCSSCGIAQTLFTFGKNEVNKEEFLRAYNKNKTTVADKEKAIRDYVNLYINFKLKVKAAEELRIDTSTQLIEELDNFRRQIVDNYMNDAQTYKMLMDQAFQRSQSDLQLIHYSVSIDPTATDTLKKFEAIKEVYNKLAKGDTNYDAIASSVDVKFSDMGFVTAFTLPYQYENLVYGLKNGEVSKPYRSKSAWHVFKIIDQRISAGKWKLAQILFTYPPDSDEMAKQQIKHLADSVYNLIKSGSNFSDLARSFSDDKLTYLNGGEMSEFGTGQFDFSFEKQVANLKKEGDISQPFFTSFGVHILKLISHTPTPTSKTDDALQFDLKQKLAQDNRISIAKEKFAKDIATKIGFKSVVAINKAALFKLADSLIANPEEDIISKLPVSQKVIFSFTKGSTKASDWLKFVNEYKLNPESYKGETNEQLWEKYKSIASLEHYRDHLEEYNIDFSLQMREFKEGNMLFEIMEKQVWSKASEDSIGLKQYYNDNSQQYKWSESADVLIMNCASVAFANSIMDSIKLGISWKKLVENQPELLQGDSTRVELTQIASPSTPVVGAFSDITKNADGTATFVKYYQLHPEGDQRTFEESRGMVINDYQNVIEKKWLEALKKRFPVKINEALLQSIIKQ